MTSRLAELEQIAPAVTGEQLDLVRKTVASGATDAELKLFLYDCTRRGIHPLDRLLHFTKRGGKYTPVTSIDFMRSQAAMSGEMAGSDDPEFENGPVGQPPLWAKVTVYRITQGQRFAYSATARWFEYCPDNAPMWKRMPHTMLGKCAEALALRKAFPQQLAGLYSREEMDQADSQVPTVQAPLLVTENRIVPSKETRNDGEPAYVTLETVTLDTETGEQLPEPPQGYFYVTGYQFNSGWHEADLLKWDAEGGALHVSTKTKQGELLSQAANFHVPITVDVTMKKQTKGEAYLNSAKLLKAPTSEPVAAGEISF